MRRIQSTSVLARVLTTLSTLAALLGGAAIVASPASANVGVNDYPYSGATHYGSTDPSTYSFVWGEAPCVYGCTAANEFTLNGTTYGEFSPFGFVYRNCTDFAAEQINKQVGGTTSNVKFGWSNIESSGDGNARAWKQGAINNYGANSVNGIPAVGSVAWWGTDEGYGYGHVAIVTAVDLNADGSVKDVVVADYNSGVGGWGNYATHTINAVGTPGYLKWPESFLHIADVTSSGAGASVPSPVSAVMPDGSLNIFAIGGGALRQDVYNSNGWTGWINRGGSGLVDTPAVVTFPDGGVSVFVSDGALYEMIYSPTSGWSGWYNLGGSGLTGTPKVVVMPDGSIHVFVSDGALYEKVYTTASGWTDWINLGGSGLVDAPDVVTFSDGSIHVFVNDGALYEMIYTPSGGWTSWINRGGSGLVGTPDAVGFSDGTISVFVNNGALYEMIYSPTSGWSGWYNLGGSGLTGTPKVMTFSDGSLNIFVNDGGALYEKVYTTASGWTDWINLGTVTGGLAGTPDAVIAADGSLDVFLSDNSGHVQENVHSSTGWTGWLDRGAVS